MFFLEELNSLGDSLGPGFGIYMVFPSVVGSLLGTHSAVLNGALCSLYRKCASERDFVSEFWRIPLSLGSTDPVLGHILFLFRDWSSSLGSFSMYS